MREREGGDEFVLSTVQDFQFQHFIIAMDDSGGFTCAGHEFPSCRDVEEVVLTIWASPNRFNGLPVITMPCQTVFF